MPAISSEYALENAPCGFLSFYPDGTIVQINKTLLKWLQYSADELVLKKKFQDIISAGGRLYYQMYVMPLLNMQDHVNEISLTLVSSANMTISCLFNASVIRHEDKTLQLIHASLFSIADRKKYEVEILKAKVQAEDEKKRFEFLANSLPNILWTTLPSGKTGFLNDRFFEYFEERIMEVNFAFLRKALFAEDLRNVLASWAAARKEELEFQLELRLKNSRRNYRWFFVTIIPYKDAEGKLLMWFGSCTDIHVQKEKQLKVLTSLNSELSAASSNVEHQTKILREVAFEQSHLVRSHLSKILGLISLLESIEVDEEAKYLISLLTQSAEELDAVISGIVKKSNFPV